MSNIEEAYPKPKRRKMRRRPTHESKYLRPGSRKNILLEAATRRAKALDLRMSGMPIRQICTQLGMNTKRAGKVYTMIKQALEEHTKDLVADYRGMENMRLDALLSSVWDRATKKDEEGNYSKGQNGAVDRALSIIKERINLNGLGKEHITKDYKVSVAWDMTDIPVTNDQLARLGVVNQESINHTQDKSGSMVEASFIDVSHGDLEPVKTLPQ